MSCSHHINPDYATSLFESVAVEFFRMIESVEGTMKHFWMPVGRIKAIAAIGPLNSRRETNYRSPDSTVPQGNSKENPFQMDQYYSNNF